MHLYGGLEALHLTQMEEFMSAEKEAREKALCFGFIDITGAMLMRPDGHSNKYGYALD